MVKNGITTMSVRRSHHEARPSDLVRRKGRKAPIARAGISPTEANPMKYSSEISGMKVNRTPSVNESARNPIAPANASKIPMTARIKTN
jgi:hypothetical protein